MPPAKKSQSRPRQQRADSSDGSADQDPPEPPGEEPRLSRNPEADPVRVHRDYVQRRLGGGALPTPEAYENALDEWHRLSGAVRGPAGEVHPETKRQPTRARPEPEAAAELFEEPPTAPGEYGGPLPATEPGENQVYTEGQR